MTQYEYRIDTTNKHGIVAKLEKLGLEGWELISTVQVNYDITFYMKRTLDKETIREKEAEVLKEKEALMLKENPLLAKPKKRGIFGMKK